MSIGNLENIKSILNNRETDVNPEMKFEDEKKGSCLLWAVQNGNFEMAQMLIHDYNADVNCNVHLDGKMTSILIAAMAFCLER